MAIEKWLVLIIKIGTSRKKSTIDIVIYRLNTLH